MRCIVGCFEGGDFRALVDPYHSSRVALVTVCVSACAFFLQSCSERGIFYIECIVLKTQCLVH